MEGPHAAVFIEDESVRCGAGKQDPKGLRFENFGQGCTPRLLAGFESDAAPPLDSLVGGAFETPLTADGFYRHNFRDAKLGCFLDHPFKMIELDQRGIERQSYRGSGRGQLFEGAKSHVLLARGLNLGQINVMIVGNFIALSGFDTEDAGEVPGIVSGNFGTSTSHLINKEPAAHTILYSS